MPQLRPGVAKKRDPLQFLGYLIRFYFSLGNLFSDFLHLSAPKDPPLDIVCLSEEKYIGTRWVCSPGCLRTLQRLSCTVSGG